MAERSAVELSSFVAAGVDDSDVEDDETARLTRGSADGDEDDPNASKVGTRDASGVPRHLATWQTAAYTLGFVILGLLVGLIGPALPALRENVGVSFERLGAVFMFRWMGSISGSALGGALLTLVADIAVRVVLPGQEMKLGVLTALIGAPFFLGLLLRHRGRAWI